MARVYLANQVWFSPTLAHYFTPVLVINGLWVLGWIGADCCLNQQQQEIARVVRYLGVGLVVAIVAAPPSSAQRVAAPAGVAVCNNGFSMITSWPPFALCLSARNQRRDRQAAGHFEFFGGPATACIAHHVPTCCLNRPVSQPGLPLQHTRTETGFFTRSPLI